MSTKINDDSMSLEIDALEVPDFLAGDRDARREALAAALKDLVWALQVLDVDTVPSTAEARTGFPAPNPRI